MMKKQMEAKLADMAEKLVLQIEGEKKNTEEAQMYKTIKDTFNAFDVDGNAELQFPEYREAWKFLQQPGTDDDIKKAFDSVDINSSGLVEWDKFVFSIWENQR